jgi:hypothetical protein
VALQVIVTGDREGRLRVWPVNKEIGFRFFVLIFSNGTEMN